MEKQDISVLFRESEAGRIYGITFIDTKNGVVANGSRLGKGYSASVFNGYFNGTGDNPFLNVAPQRNNRQGQPIEEESRSDDIIAGIADGLWDMPTAQGVDYKEMAFQKKMRRLHSGKNKKKKTITYIYRRFMSQEEDDLRGLAKIMDFMRAISILFMLVHCSWFCYGALKEWNLTLELVDKILLNFQRNTGLFPSILWTKLFIVLFLGFVLFFLNFVLLELPYGAVLYVITLSVGYILLLMGGIWIGRLLKNNLMEDVFNMENESFMQETRLMENEYSVNQPTRFYYRKKWNKGWINVVNTFRATIVLGMPGSGKSYAVVNNFIKQQIEKFFAMYIYDYKFPYLSEIAYNHLIKHADSYEEKPSFYVINFDDPRCSHRCNPINPDFMSDISDAYESVYTIMFNQNRSWIQKAG